MARLKAPKKVRRVENTPIGAAAAVVRRLVELHGGKKQLTNLIVGVGEWLGVDCVELKPMPFRSVGELVPEFVTQLRARKKISHADYFPSPSFYLNHGSDASAKERIWLGTSGQPKSEQSLVEIMVEQVRPKSGETFLWICRKVET